MTPDELTQATQLFLNVYIVGAGPRTEQALGGPAGPGIRRRQPAVVDIPPEFSDIPDANHNLVFAAGTGPESSPVRYRFLDLCPLDRATVTPSDTGADIQFLFIVRYGPGELDPNIKEPVCLPSGDQLLAIVSECLNQLQQYFGAAADLGDAETSFTPSYGTDMQVLSNAEFLPLELPDVTTL